MINPFQPPSYLDSPGTSKPGFVDIDFTYPYDVVLTALQTLTDQSLAIQNDADFAWCAVIVSAYTGAFSIRFSDTSGYYLSSGLINYNAFLDGGNPIPYPIFPEVIIPAGGRIGIDITDLSNASNTVEVLFRGVKRYRLPQQ